METKTAEVPEKKQCFRDVMRAFIDIETPAAGLANLLKLKHLPRGFGGARRVLEGLFRGII
jgi:hypothetical protein